MMQVERDNLYSAFYKLTDSRSQITSYVFDVGAQAASRGPFHCDCLWLARPRAPVKISLLLRCI